MTPPPDRRFSSRVKEYDKSKKGYCHNKISLTTTRASFNRSRCFKQLFQWEKWERTRVRTRRDERYGKGGVISWRTWGSNKRSTDVWGEWHLALYFPRTPHALDLRRVCLSAVKICESGRQCKGLLTRLSRTCIVTRLCRKKGWRTWIMHAAHN